MIPVLFRLGPLTVYSYGVMMALGFLVADWVISYQCRERKLDPGYASSLVVWAAIVGIAGSRVLDILNNLPSYLAHPSTMIFSGSGFDWYGGLIGGIASVYFVARYYRIPFLLTADMCAPALAIGQALGRIGCLVSGDGDWGLPSTVPWAMSFPRAIVGWNSQTVLKLGAHHELVSGFFPGVRVHPTPIYEAILYTGVFALIWFLRNKGLAPGRMLYLYLMLADAARFVVEFWRINPRVFMGLTEFQLFAIPLMIIGAVGWIISGERQGQEAAKAAMHA
jgi:phosphatidylglycerol---prolipoprotein diacylglyceryl transferase